MKELALTEFKKKFLAAFKKFYDQERKKERRAIEDALKAAHKKNPEAAPMLPPEDPTPGKTPLATHDLAVNIEALLDAAISTNSKVYDLDDGGISGKVAGVTRKDNFIMAVEFDKSPETYNTLFEMEGALFVRVSPAQKMLFKADGTPGPGAGAKEPKHEEAKT